METNEESLPPIDLVLRSSSGAVGVEVRGDVDAATVDVLCAALEAADEAPKLVVDLSATQFIDLAGVRALATCARRRRARGRDLLVLAPPPSAESILQMAPFCWDLQWQARERRPAARSGS